MRASLTESFSCAGFTQLKPLYASDMSFEKMAGTFKSAMAQYEEALRECMRKEKTVQEPSRAGEKSCVLLVLSPRDFLSSCCVVWLPPPLPGSLFAPLCLPMLRV